jgi:hypothetical protein
LEGPQGPIGPRGRDGRDGANGRNAVTLAPGRATFERAPGSLATNKLVVVPAAGGSRLEITPVRDQATGLMVAADIELILDAAA